MSHARVIVAINSGKDLTREEIEDAVALQMLPFDENGECFRDGSRWDWYVIGGRFSKAFDGADIIQVKDMDLDKMMRNRRESYTRAYEDAAKENHESLRELIYGVDPDKTTLDEWLATIDDVKFPASYAFLRDLHWHEGERMGWFGLTAKTECEIALEKKSASVEDMIRRCKYRDDETGASLVCWNEPWEVWQQEFYHRFIEPLPETTYLVNVDYHV